MGEEYKIKLLTDLMEDREGEHLEFKEAKDTYDFKELIRYCVALANECGGKFILGVTNKKPRKVVGTNAFRNTDKLKQQLIDSIHLRIDINEIYHPDGRVLLIEVPSRPIGMPLEYEGAYWMRIGESLRAMTPNQLKKIFDEAEPDFSAEICSSAVLDDLNAAAINKLKTLWAKKSGKPSILAIPDAQILRDLELVENDKVTYAALILLGTRQALGRHLAQSEVVFEYRSSDATGPAQDRKEYREGFLLFYDDIWNTINLRNDKQHYQDGLFVWDIPTFNERVVREALLNAVSHRDYKLQGSVFVRQFSRRIEIVSPGGFPSGINEQNILWQQSPRNRRIAEVFAKCALVERAGQGMNLMFEECIRESKAKPNFKRSDDYQVFLTFDGNIKDQNFLKFIEKVGKEKQLSFITEDLLIMDAIHTGSKVSEKFKDRVNFLLDNGIIEKTGKNKYILSRHFYKFVGKEGVYTRKKGLDKETNKTLLLKHIKDNAEEGSRLQDMQQVLPQLSYIKVQNLLRELKIEKKVYCQGKTKAAKWFPMEHVKIT